MSQAERPSRSLLNSVSEDAWLRQVIELAQLLGWRVFHARPARTERGWRTAVSGDGAGFPDIVATRGGRIIAAELKAERGRVSAEQYAWLDALSAAGVDTYIWRPSQWSEVVEVLRREAA